MAAFKGTLTLALGNGSAGPSFRFSASDAAAAFVTWDDLPGTPAFITVPASGYRLRDLSVSAVGGTVVALVFVKGVATTDKIIRMGVLLETLSGMDGTSRLGQFYNMPLEPGAQYGIKQL